MAFLKFEITPRGKITQFLANISCLPYLWLISMTHSNPTLIRLIAPLPFKSVLKTGKLSSFKLLMLVLRRVIQLLPDSLFDL